jgi:hypothetical protein
MEIKDPSAETVSRTRHRAAQIAMRCRTTEGALLADAFPALTGAGLSARPRDIVGTASFEGIGVVTEAM